jgi:hypothetical protein
VRLPLPLLSVLLATLSLACNDLEPIPAAPPAAIDPLDTACADIARDQCAALKPCCDAAGFDMSQCETGVAARCAPFVADVRAGTAKYDPAAAAACGMEEKTTFAVCDLSLITYTAASGVDLLSCERIFTTGTAQPGEHCASDNDCAPVSHPGTLVYCDSDNDLCDIIHILGEGEPCVSSESGGVIELCGTDLYCLHDTGPASGHCVSKTPIGGACAGDAVAPCVSAAYCDGPAKTCAPLEDGGGACTVPSQCKSLTCSGGECAPVVPFLTAGVCAGNDR